MAGALAPRFSPVPLLATRSVSPLYYGGAMEPELSLPEWEADLRYALAAGPGAWPLVTVANCSSPTASSEVIAVARRVVDARGLPIIELDARTVAADPDLLPSDSGFVILHDVVSHRVEVSVLLGAFQHLLQRGLLVGLLVVGSPAGIKALRRETSLGLLNRAEVLNLS
ncbi:hypothetical protein SAMN04487913_110171 [Arthrobacter sp. ok362]|nr:hypothetical protein SAMN04487913_110171 [Arthrobacter sp. ok362]